MERRALVAVIGDGGAAPSERSYEEACRVGRLAVDRGYRVASGGLGGVMEAAFRGARESASYRDGDTVAILPHSDPSRANAFADIVICTGLGHLRNAIVASSDAVVALGGGAGTLSEISFAWMQGRLVVALELSGWSQELADRRLDDKVRHPGIPEDRIFSARDADEALDLVDRWLPRYRAKSG